MRSLDQHPGRTGSLQARAAIRAIRAGALRTLRIIERRARLSKFKAKPFFSRSENPRAVAISLTVSIEHLPQGAADGFRESRS